MKSKNVFFAFHIPESIIIGDAQFYPPKCDLLSLRIKINMINKENIATYTLLHIYLVVVVLIFTEIIGFMPYQSKCSWSLEWWNNSAPLAI